MLVVVMLLLYNPPEFQISRDPHHASTPNTHNLERMLKAIFYNVGTCHLLDNTLLISTARFTININVVKGN